MRRRIPAIDIPLSTTVAPSGMRDSKAEVISSKAGVPSGVTAIVLVMGKIYLGLRSTADPRAQK